MIKAFKLQWYEMDPIVGIVDSGEEYFETKALADRWIKKNHPSSHWDTEEIRIFQTKDYGLTGP